MKQEEPLAVSEISDRTVGGTIAPNVLALSPDLTLVFHSGGRDDAERPAGAMLTVVAGPRLRRHGVESAIVPIQLNVSTLGGQIAKCTEVWWRHIVEAQHLTGTSAYFTYHVQTQCARDRTFDSRARKIAIAGQVLFSEIFCPDSVGYSRTEELGCLLRDALLAEDGLQIVVRSNEFFVPWNLLHLGDRAHTAVEDFLGSRHVVEQDVSDSPLVADGMPRPDVVAVHFDRNMDIDKPTNVHAAVANFESLLIDYGLPRVDRNTKTAFLDALSTGVDESLLYFMCHGTAGSDVRANSDDTRLFLTLEEGEDEDGISPSDIGNSLKQGGDLKGRPLVFLNACRATKSGSIYYQGFAPRFLNKKARAVIGPEIEMPILFAREFARRFFEDFFRGTAENSIGRVLLKLRREYLLVHANPLGLTYSLYRGAGHYLAVGVPRANARGDPDA
jgi:hypothetical protein